MVFAEAFGLVHPAQKFDMYQKLNQRSWHLMTYSNKHSNWTGWGLKVTIHSHASFHEQIIAASLTSKSTLSVTILQGFIQTVLASANRFQLNNDPQENVLMHVCLLQASSWSTWPVFYLNCCVYYSLNSGLRKLSAAHETSCTFHFRKKRKTENQSSILKTNGSTGRTLVHLLASIRRTWRQKTTFGDDTTFVSLGLV